LSDVTQLESRPGTRRVLETIAFHVLLVIVGLRPLIAETYDSAVTSIGEAISLIAGPSPARTLIMDVAILAAGLLCLTAGAFGPPRPRLRRTGLTIAVVVLSVAAVVSTLSAGQKRLAANASLDWLCGVVVALTLMRLVGGCAARRRVLLGVVLAGAVVQAFECGDQYFTGFADTQRHYEGIREEFWARQGVPLDDPKVALYEQRLRAHEATGFFPHSNVAGSYLVLCAFAAGGVVVRRVRELRRRPTVPSSGTDVLHPALGMVAFAVVIGAVILTGSRGAIVSAACGALLWVVLAVADRRVARNHRRALLVGWGAAVGVMLVVVLWGLSRGTLPTDSLRFRWSYWQASAEMIAEHPTVGVGRENFGRHYTRYKSIESPEEVANPHNLLVQSASEWGVVGLVGMVVLLVGASVRLTTAPIRRTTAPGTDTATERVEVAGGTPTGSRKRNQTEPGNAVVALAARLSAWGVGSAFAVLPALLVVRSLLLGTDDPGFVYYTTVMTALMWVAGWVVFVPASASRMSVAAGLLALVIHDLINFALFVPGVFTTAFALYAWAATDDSSGDEVAWNGRTARARASGAGEESARHRSTARAEARGAGEESAPCRSAARAEARGSGEESARHRSAARARASGAGEESARHRSTARAEARGSGEESARHRSAARAEARGSGEEGTGRRRAALGVCVLGWVGATLVVVFVIVPPVRAQRALEAARALRGTAPLSPLEGGPVEAAYRRAARLDPWDPTPLVEWSEYLAAVAALPVSEGRRFALRESAIEALERGMARDPDSVGLRRMGARLRLEQARLRPDASTCRAAEDAARATIDRYPQDPRGWVVLAEALLTTGESLSDPERCAEAAKYLEHARRLDQRRHNYAQEVRSLTAGEQRRIAAYLERAEQCAASNP
jgi:hypothetical protein